MRFGVREICDVVFKAKADVTIGSKSFKKGQPVLYIDSAKTSTIEGAATTVYATGGRGNTRLISWEGEKTLTFTVEDALLSPIGFSVLSGAGLFKGLDEAEKVHVHVTAPGYCSNGSIDLTEALDGSQLCTTAPIFVVAADQDGSLSGAMLDATVADDGASLTKVSNGGKLYTGNVFCDFYVLKKGNEVSELQIDAANFAGYYYVEASTLFRRQNDGKDLPAEITFPNVKIQSNFTFTMASTGDPSTFTFTMDAMPGHTYFDQSKKVLCVMQIIEEDKDPKINNNSVMDHADDHERGVSLDSTGEYPETTGTLKALSKTAAPALSEENVGTVTWEAIEGATSYEISYKVGEDTFEKHVTKTEFKYPEGTTSITVTPRQGDKEGKSQTSAIPVIKA